MCLLHLDWNYYEKVLAKEFRKKCDMHMILIKIDCYGCFQMLCGLSIWSLLAAVRVIGLMYVSLPNSERICLPN